MSAIVNPSPAPTQTPERLAPQRVPPSPAWHSRWKWGWVALTLLVAAAANFAFRGKPQESVAQTAIRTAKVAMGPLETVLRVSGTTAARDFASITAPMMRGPDAGRNLILIKLAAAGTFVKKGELVAQIDAQPIKDHIDDLDTLVSQAEADIKKRRAEHAIEMETLRQTLRAAQAAWDKAKLDAKASEIRTSIDQELLQLSVDEAAAQYKQLQAEVATTEEKQRSEIRILEYTRARHALHRDRHKRDLQKFTIMAPIGGLVVMQSIWRSGDFGQIQAGDQVWPGQPFMKLVNPSSMQLEAGVNQAESEAMQIGQTARLSFDAFPDLHLNGRVVAVGAMGVGGWRENYYIRNIPVRVAIQNIDARVIPDLSASADVSLGRKERVLVAPLAAVESEGGKDIVFVKQRDRFVPRQVELGARNYTQVEILAGLSDGDEVALGRPTPALQP